mmetsp:Transcript_20901/g.52475  ORF Transcript_20901/g.52475 Transcript_20901/m.52475 type:complete len:208 (-) Transcript_20901:1022-1645(-)
MRLEGLKVVLDGLPGRAVRRVNHFNVARVLAKLLVLLHKVMKPVKVLARLNNKGVEVPLDGSSHHLPIQGVVDFKLQRHGAIDRAVELVSVVIQPLANQFEGKGCVGGAKRLQFDLPRIPEGVEPLVQVCQLILNLLALIILCPHLCLDIVELLIHLLALINRVPDLLLNVLWWRSCLCDFLPQLLALPLLLLDVQRLPFDLGVDIL